jgi:hypothetical protein
MRIPRYPLAILALIILALNPSHGKTCSDHPSNTITLDSDENRLQLNKDGKPVFRYLIKPSTESTNHAPHYSRSGYIHPLFSPSGRVVTDDYASDHPHQHGLFFAWTKSSFRGKPTEFWNQAKKLGDIRFHRYQGEEQRPESHSFLFEQIFTTGKDSDKPILKETWRIDVPSKAMPYHQFDLVSTQTCATKGSLFIQKYHYGGMAIRGNPQWMKKDDEGKPKGKMITSDGKTRKNGNHSRPRWVAMYGPVDGQECGVVVMNHPDNFRYPQWVRLHPSMPYFVYSPMVEEPFSIEPGKPYVSKFRYLTFDGEPDLKLVEKIWKDWAGK